ncbi:hypothetical protein [Paenibacillus taiwanensis]|uniref:hypothetical protein n=1 Tax=Paenibacillus taiwanensis TaxID=401638 RepID=UPI00040EB8A4|nr:hypothetical protein [Paenibacillus taiwanensis]
MKKSKLPGDNISLKTKKSEDPLIMDWINAQTNLMDSLRYLIEQEIVQQGIRNLQAVVPVERNVLAAVTTLLPQFGLEERSTFEQLIEDSEDAQAKEELAKELDDELVEGDIEAWV